LTAYRRLADSNALTDRWGTDETPDHIVLNGQRKSIRKNLAEAIRAIRMTDKIVPIWIDAMSINQDDVMERTRQVRRMGQIYDNAMSVYSFVGLPDQSTEDVSHFIAELNKHPMVRMNNSGEFHLGDWEYVDGTISYGENMIRADRLAKLCAALYRFLTRQYFRRCWILQVSSSKKSLLWCSTDYNVGGGIGVESYYPGRPPSCNFRDA
jgi:hypothetical protein